MSGGKGGSSTNEVTIPEYIEAAAQRNLNKAERISQIGYTPYYGPDVAAFTPMQQAAFQNTADTAGAFGMAAPTSQQDIMGGMPAPTTYAGGVQGYSSAPMFEQSLDELGRQRPGQKSYIDSFFIDPFTGGGANGNFAPIDYTQYGTMADQARRAVADAASGGGGGSVDAVYTSTDFQGNEVPYTIIEPTTVRPDGFVDNTPGNFTEQRQYPDSSPMGTGGPAIMQSGDGTSVNLGFDLAPSVAGGRGTIVPGQPSNYTGFGDMFDGGGKGTSGDTYSGGGVISNIGNTITGSGSGGNVSSTPDTTASSGGSFFGYDGIGDMFDGGGKLSSGDTYQNVFTNNDTPAPAPAPAPVKSSYTPSPAPTPQPYSAAANTAAVAANKAKSSGSSSSSSSSSSSGGNCVVATHAVESGAFTPNMKREAVVWCMDVLHGKWWGEAIRRGYRHLGSKKIAQGKAREHYSEFRRYIAFARGKDRTLRGAITFTFRTAQFFAVGLVKRDA